MIKHWISDSELEEEMIQLLKKRQLDPKFLYLGKGAKGYYSAYGSGNIKKQENTNKNNLLHTGGSYINFIKKNILENEQGKKGVIVSLGCGNGFQEIGILEEFINIGVKIDYIGVDCSKGMLSMANSNLHHLDVKKQFVCADFTSIGFSNEIHEATEEYDYRIFCFLGCTFGNPNQTDVTDSLYNVLGSKDYLLLDALTRVEEGPSLKLKLFERYTGYLENEEMKKFRFTPLEYVGVPYNNGKMILKTENENSIGAFVFKFYFEFTKRTVVSFKGKRIHFLPGETIELLSVRNYDLTILKSFFENHDFFLCGEEVVDFNGGLSSAQLLFKRK